MELVCLVLHDAEKLEGLLTALSKENFSGATVLDCQGMGEILLRSQKKEEIPFFDILSDLLDSDTKSKFIFMVLRKEMAEKARYVVRNFLGGLESPKTGIMFGIPLSFTEGIRG